MQGNSSVIATIALVFLVLLAFASYSFYSTNSALSSVSSQNAGLKGQMASLNQQESSMNQQVSNLNQQVSILEQRTLTVVTMTNTVVYVQTTTSVTTTISVSTTSVYPVPDNVTVLFTQVNGAFNYIITAGSASYTGSDDAQVSIPIASVFQGETVTVTASEMAFCGGYNTVTARIYLNGQVVAFGTQLCGSSNLDISYTI